MKQLAEYIISNIIEQEQYSVTENEEDGKINIEIKVDKTVIGLLIGKGGNTIKAIQTLLRVRGRLENKLVNVSIIEA